MKINGDMAKKKTIKVQETLDYANYQLGRTDEYATKEFKEGVIVMIEQILHLKCSIYNYDRIDHNRFTGSHCSEGP